MFDWITIPAFMLDVTLKAILKKFGAPWTLGWGTMDMSTEHLDFQCQSTRY